MADQDAKALAKTRKVKVQESASTEEPTETSKA